MINVKSNIHGLKDVISRLQTMSSKFDVIGKISVDITKSELEKRKIKFDNVKYIKSKSGVNVKIDFGSEKIDEEEMVKVTKDNKIAVNVLNELAEFNNKDFYGNDKNQQAIKSAIKRIMNEAINKII